MNERSTSRSSFWLLPLSVLCLAGTWLFAQRVLVPFQVADAALHDRPRGNLSDLYPRWVGTRELLLHGRNPYSPEVTREIQLGYYGRVLDATRPGDPKDQQAFAYPVYVVFYLAPTARMRFAAVQRAFFWILIALTLASLWLWLRVLNWTLPWWGRLSAAAFLFGSFPVMQGLKLQQITLFVAALIALAVLCLVRGRASLAGFLLALATIKPQLVVGVVLWFAIWTLGDWKRRYRWALSAGLTILALSVAAELCLPNWIPQFLHAMREYQAYTGAVPLLDELLTPIGGVLAEIAIGIAVACVCWKNRKHAATSSAFAFTTVLVLAATLLLVPSFALYNQVLLLPGIFLLVRDRRIIAAPGAIGRILLVTAAVLLCWQWLTAVVLAAMSFFVSPELVEKAWALPSWTSLTLPVAVAAVMLLQARRPTLEDSPDLIPS